MILPFKDGYELTTPIHVTGKQFLHRHSAYPAIIGFYIYTAIYTATAAHTAILGLLRRHRLPLTILSVAILSEVVWN